MSGVRSKANWIILAPGIALAYFLAARLGQVFALGSSEITPVWPASGLALAAVCLLGQRALPGLLLGSLLFHVHTYLKFLPLGSAAAIGAVIAAGTTLQALTGQWLLTQWLGDTGAGTSWRWLRSFVVASPGLVLLSPVIGTAVLGLFGVDTGLSWWQGWLGWWFGDWCGVLVFTPLILFSASPRHLLNQNRFYLMIALMALVTISVGALTLGLLYNNIMQAQQDNLGDLTAIHELFIRTGAIAALAAVLLIIVSALLFRHISTPILKSLEQKYEEQEDLVRLRTQELEENKAWVDNILEATPGTVYECLDDAGWTLRYLGRNIQQLCGYPADDFLAGSRGLADIIHPADLALVRTAIREAANQNRVYTPEYRVLHADGSVRWVFEQGRVSWSHQEGVHLRNGSLIDITQKKAAEVALKASQQRLALAMRAGRMNPWERDLETGDTTIGLFMEEVLGHAPGDPGDSQAAWIAAVLPEDMERMQQAFGACVQTQGEEVYLQYRARAQDGTLRWISLTGMVTERDASGRALKMAGLQHDITEQRSAEMLIQEKITELEQFNKLAIGRELRMVELKAEVNALHARLQEPRPYPGLEDEEAN